MSRLRTPPHDMLSRLLAPLADMMPTDFARKLVALRAEPQVQARIEELADKRNEGELTPEERAEYLAYVDAVDVGGVLQAKARGVLSRRSAD